MATSPSTNNYSILKATVAFTPDGGSSTALGDVAEAEFSPSIEKLDHYSHQTGIRSKDKSVIVEAGGTIRLLIDEITNFNISLFLAGTVTDNLDSTYDVAIMDNDATTGVLVITGTNTVGNKITATFNNVSFAPSGSMGLISDEWGQIEITGEVLVDGSGDFGIWVVDES